MANNSIGLDDSLGAYVAQHTSDLHPVQTRLVEQTAALGPMSIMQIGPEQGEFMRLLAQVLQPRSIVEVGTFTGYSALALALGAGPECRILCCDVSEEWTALARAAWTEAGVADQIELVIQPAIETLRGLPDEPTIDLAFIDADKPSYVDYYEALVTRLAPRGVILIDNTLWSGTVADEANQEHSTIAIRELNRHVAADSRTRQVVLPVGDGLTMVTLS